MKDLWAHLAAALALFGAEVAGVVRYSLGSWERTTRLTVLIIVVMVGLHFLR